MIWHLSKGEMNGQWRWEHVAQLHLSWADLSHADNRKQTQVGWTIPSFCCVFSCARRTNRCCFPPICVLHGFPSLCRSQGLGWAALPAAPLQREMDQEDVCFLSQHRSVYTQQEFSEVSRRGWTANYCHCVPIGCHPFLLANRIVFR